VNLLLRVGQNIKVPQECTIQSGTKEMSITKLEPCVNRMSNIVFFTKNIKRDLLIPACVDFVT
jgi:hypothetical protein